MTILDGKDRTGVGGAEPGVIAISVFTRSGGWRADGAQGRRTCRILTGGHASLLLRDVGLSALGPDGGGQRGPVPLPEDDAERGQRREKGREKIMKIGKISSRPRSMTSDSRIIAQSE